MYTFHKTSMEKLQSEALLQGLSWNFISTSRIKMEKIHTQKKKEKKNPDIIFFLVPWKLHLLYKCCVGTKKAEPNDPESCQCSSAIYSCLALPNILPIFSRAAGNIHAVCVQEERCRKSLLFLSRSML